MEKSTLSSDNNSIQEVVNPEELELISKINKLKTTFLNENFEEKIKDVLKHIPDLQFKNLIIETNSDIQKSINFLKTYIALRLEYEENWVINKISVIGLIQSKMAFWHKHDKSNIPCLIIRVRNFIAADHKASDIIRFMFFMIDQIYLKIKSKKENKLKKFCVIYDRQGFDNEKNFTQEVVERLKSYRETNVANFSEAIHKTYICNVNFFFRMMFKIAKVFIPKKYVGKIQLLGDTENLLEFFDADCLLKEYGGNSTCENEEN